MTTFDPDHNHADAIAYRYQGTEPGKLDHLSTAELLACAESVSPEWRTDWDACRALADRSGIAHEFEAGYSRDLEERYIAVRALVPEADPLEWGGEFDAAYDAYADSHPEILVPTARALEWAREQVEKEQNAS